MVSVISQERRTAIRFDAGQSTDFLPSRLWPRVSDPLKARPSGKCALSAQPVSQVRMMLTEAGYGESLNRKAKGEANDDEKKYP